MVEILEGLSDGEQIINHPEEYELKDGEKVWTKETSPLPSVQIPIDVV